MILNQWTDELIWCPSQCYYYTVREGISYVLYLRWRHGDPWSGYIIAGVKLNEDITGEQAQWSDDIELTATKYEVDKAKQELMAIFEKQMGL